MNFERIFTLLEFFGLLSNASEAAIIKAFQPFSRHSSVVEQLIRNQQAEGSNPPAGSSEIKGLAQKANPIFCQG
jgi:hypothetical protein